jgi:hypothetical protein
MLAYAAYIAIKGVVVPISMRRVTPVRHPRVVNGS